jgi:hypothetical protein
MRVILIMRIHNMHAGVILLKLHKYRIEKKSVSDKKSMASKSKVNKVTL